MNDGQLQALLDGRDHRRQRDLAVWQLGGERVAHRGAAARRRDEPGHVDPGFRLNQPFSRAMANGTPYIPVPKWVTLRSTANAEVAASTPAAAAAPKKSEHACLQSG